MHHAEAVGDERAVIADELDERLGQLQPLSVVLAGLTCIEADVLQQQDVTFGQAFGAGECIGPDDIAGELHVPTEPVPQRFCDRSQ